MGLGVARGPEDNNVVKTVGGIEPRFFPIQTVSVLTQVRAEAFVFKYPAEGRGIDLDRYFIESLDVLIDEGYRLDAVARIGKRNTQIP